MHGRTKDWQDASTSSDVPRDRFEPLLKWSGRVTLDANGEASVEVPTSAVPATFRIVAVAHSDVDFFGTGHQT